MASVQANGIRLEYDQLGAVDDPVILLIMGLATQMIAWPDSLCRALARRGFRVLRFDNRDVGLSTKLDGLRPPGLLRTLLSSRFRLPLEVPYTLNDMALDTVGLLDALRVESAHVVGASMGGMIAQILAAEHGHRVRSLVSLMSSSGDPRLPGADARVLRHMLLLRPRREDREAFIAYAVDFWRMVGSPAYPTPPEELREKISRSLDRSSYGAGFGRQLAAILASGSRVAQLQRISAPTLVIHGEQDRLVPLAAGVGTAARVPGARLEVIPGMGHDLPAALIPRLTELIAGHAAAAESVASSAARARAGAAAGSGPAAF